MCLVLKFRFAEDVRQMIGSPISRYWKITWKYVAPFMIAGLLLATFISKIVNPITYTVYDKTEVSHVPTVLCGQIRPCRFRKRAG